MANPAPCQACLEAPDAEFCVTNRLGVPWPFEQAVINLCMPCFMNLGITMGTALQEALAMIEAEGQPGALEAVESEEGPVKVAPARTKRAPRKKAPTPVAVLEPASAEESEAPDDQR